MHESTIRAQERDRLRREAYSGSMVCPCCGREDIRKLQARDRRNGSEIMQQLGKLKDLADYIGDLWGHR